MLIVWLLLPEYIDSIQQLPSLCLRASSARLPLQVTPHLLHILRHTQGRPAGPHSTPHPLLHSPAHPPDPSASPHTPSPTLATSWASLTPPPIPSPTLFLPGLPPVVVLSGGILLRTNPRHVSRRVPAHFEH